MQLGPEACSNYNGQSLLSQAPTGTIKCMATTLCRNSTSLHKTNNHPFRSGFFVGADDLGQFPANMTAGA